MAVFLDLENIALGARDAHYPSFDIQKVLERLLLKGQIVVKKGQLEVSKMDSPKQGEPRDPKAPKIQRKGGSGSQTRARPQSEGSSKG